MCSGNVVPSSASRTALPISHLADLGIDIRSPADIHGRLSSRDFGLSMDAAVAHSRSAGLRGERQAHLRPRRQVLLPAPAPRCAEAARRWVLHPHIISRTLASLLTHAQDSFPLRALMASSAAGPVQRTTRSSVLMVASSRSIFGGGIAPRVPAAVDRTQIFDPRHHPAGMIPTRPAK